MNLATVLHQYHDTFLASYGNRLLPSHHRALAAILRCRTREAGEQQVRCPDCHYGACHAMSCGHRSCPRCQNHDVSRWLDRQQVKALPVGYFMTTFTLPYELRALAWSQQRTVYRLFFAGVSSTLRDFGLNPKHLGAELAMTAVLHTHNRRLDYHPHIHVVIPGGGIDTARKQWRKITGQYLFPERALARVFRARFLAAITNAGLRVPPQVPRRWVVDCKHVGNGQGALTYLSRYLYRGVISEKNIVSTQHGNVTFKYVESRTGKTRYRTLKGEDFVWLVLQHVLPKRFRRLRDYGFLHGNAKKRLSLVQLVLHVVINAGAIRPRPVFICPKCQSTMRIVAVFRPAWPSG